MATGSTLSALLASAQAKVVAAAVAGTLVLGGGAATLAATGAIHLGGKSTTGDASHTPSAQSTDSAAGAAARQQACTQSNGDAERLAQTYTQNNLFKTEGAARTEICLLFVGTHGRAFGFGEVEQMLDLAATIKSNAAAHSASNGCTLTYTGDVDALLNTMMTDVANGTPLEQLERTCGATAHGKPDATPGAKPTGTPGHRP